MNWNEHKTSQQVTPSPFTTFLPKYKILEIHSRSKPTGKTNIYQCYICRRQYTLGKCLSIIAITICKFPSSDWECDFSTTNTLTHSVIAANTHIFKWHINLKGGYYDKHHLNCKDLFSGCLVSRAYTSCVCVDCHIARCNNESNEHRRQVLE